MWPTWNLPSGSGANFSLVILEQLDIMSNKFLSHEFLTDRVRKLLQMVSFTIMGISARIPPH